MVIFLGACERKDNVATTYNRVNPDFIAKEKSTAYPDRMESTPVVYNNKVYDVVSVRKVDDPSFEIYDVLTGQLVSKVRLPVYFGGALSYANKLYVYGTSNYEISAPLKIYESTDLINFAEVGSLSVRLNERIFNSSLIHDNNKFVIAVEVDRNGDSAFAPNFYESTDLTTWTKTSELKFTSYIACPTIRFVGGNYYLFYLLWDRDAQLYYTSISKSSDLVTWEQSNKVVLTPTDESEGQNNSDLDLYEFNGQVGINYAIGNQDNNRPPWVDIKKAKYNGTLESFVKEFFP
jgi:hypothetical protein